MAAPNYEQIQSFGNVTRQLKQAAINEFLQNIADGMTVDEIMSVAARIAEKYKRLGAELGAQWYDLCTELAGIKADPAFVGNVDNEAVEGRAQAYANRARSENLSHGGNADTLAEFARHVFEEFLQNEINESIRTTGKANLWRDYERGLAPGKWARVPQGPTCAWCIMLASNGAWYLTRESALGDTPDHYHDGCDCIAVYHADAESINGYTELAGYKRMYYAAENRRMANKNGKDPYPDDLKLRISTAKKKHEERERKREEEAAERGEEYKKKPWTQYNEDMILMREMYGLK